MTFVSFKAKINRKIRKSGAEPVTVFLNDMDKGIYRAVFADGMQITARPNGDFWSVHLPNMPKRVAYMIPASSFN